MKEHRTSDIERPTSNWRPSAALHEPAFRLRRRSRPRPRSGDLASMSKTTTRTNRFKVPSHAQKRKRVFNEPGRSSKRRLPWESGAKDARTPNATAWSADSAASAKRLECVRFIGALRPARGGRRFMVPTHGIKVVGAFHEPTRPSNCSRPWESGAEDARTPNATAWSIDPAAKVPLLGGARGGFMIPRHAEKRMPAFDVGCWMLDVGCFSHHP
jgi:hypothetical protein